ncbi:hypothetical protein sce6001 [Sorangium cellulosum So ce56]|uniref:Uncharacterized protein n=1 Tax=Sorangium cellulosum (strain So ce56) TaxID=448385 RepID=A9GCB6_SORC5|nr:hypothetical protein [Sorangium cellulosum]CAN96165.1 hypothetical protein sce6001 [Sorangium cellulosum So ce56]
MNLRRRVPIWSLELESHEYSGPELDEAWNRRAPLVQGHVTAPVAPDESPYRDDDNTNPSSEPTGSHHLDGSSRANLARMYSGLEQKILRGFLPAKQVTQRQKKRASNAVALLQR